jgi:putative FmdB family regulatory protein
MPIYTYVCTKCGHKKEELLPVDERDKEQECPLDNALMERVITPAARTPLLWDHNRHGKG